MSGANLRLVAGDEGTRESVQQALEELGSNADAIGVRPTIQARVVDVPAFRAETQGGGA